MPQRSTLRRRDREKEQRRREILTHALRIFCDQGYERATMNEIALQADYAVGTLYKFFEHKQALYESLVLETLRGASRIAAAALSGGGNEIDRMERYIDMMSKLMLRYPAAAKLYFTATTSQGLGGQLELSEECRNVHQRYQDRVAATLRTGMERGYFSALDAKVVAIAMHGMAGALFAEAMKKPSDWPAPRFAELWKRILFEPVRLKPRIRLSSTR